MLSAVCDASDNPVTIGQILKSFNIVFGYIINVLAVINA